MSPRKTTFVRTALLLGVAGGAIVALVVRARLHGGDVGPAALATSQSPAKCDTPPEHAVTLHLPLSKAGFGAKDEALVCQQIEDDLEDEIDRAGAGEMDGNEIGDGECTLFMYGPDADKLFAAIASRARSSRLGRRAWAIKRYGSVDDPNAREVRVDL
jgi:hypothetical protein